MEKLASDWLVYDEIIPYSNGKVGSGYLIMYCDDSMRFYGDVTCGDVTWCCGDITWYYSSQFDISKIFIGGPQHGTL